MNTKLYESKDWLIRHYKINHESVESIAQRCGVSKNTIRSALKKFNIIK